MKQPRVNVKRVSGVAVIQLAGEPLVTGAYAGWSVRKLIVPLVSSTA
jgi:hypothetical protein